MNKSAAFVLKWHPYAVVLTYTGLISEYRHHLDVSLNFIKPAVPVAPEDILGYGFLVTWLVMLTWLLIAGSLSYWVGLQRKIQYWMPIFFSFGLLSIVDLLLYRILERQVLN